MATTPLVVDDTPADPAGASRVVLIQPRRPKVDGIATIRLRS